MFGETSESRLATCDPDIRTVLRTVIQSYDFSVLCGHRTEDEQAALYAQGRTAPGEIVTYKQWPNSDHNTFLSQAVDLAPYPIDWDDIGRFYELAGRVLQVAYLLEIPLKWAGHWPKFKDYPHFYLTRVNLGVT